jgi:DNA-directed RNA polymerase specialized sigma24 family protein
MPRSGRGICSRHRSAEKRGAYRDSDSGTFRALLECRRLRPAGITRECRPERTYLNNEQVAIARRALSCLQPREREALRRFYVDEHSSTDICLQKKLTRAQFRLLNHAKSRFADCGKSLL